MMKNRYITINSRGMKGSLYVRVSIAAGIAAFILICGILTGCDSAKNDSLVYLTRQPGVVLLKGEALFMQEVLGLIPAQGVIPTTLATEQAAFFDNYPGLTRKSPIDYYEFFVFDKNNTLIVLSTNPFYFLKIESRSFYYHLTGELKQIAAGTSGTDKIVNTSPYYRDVGEYSVEIYFTPKEMKFSSSGVNQYRILDNNGTTYVDPWRLIEAAAINIMYFPSFEDEKLNADLVAGSAAGQFNCVYSNNIVVSSPVNNVVTGVNLNFSFMSGRYLSLTEDLLGAEDVRFADWEELMRDFIIYFSIPPGNSMGTADTDNYLSFRDGIVVVVRGHNLAPLRYALTLEGIPVY